MEVLDGKLVRNKELLELKELLTKLEDKLSLVAISAGGYPSSKVYFNELAKMAEYLDCSFKKVFLPEDVTLDRLIDTIDKYNKDLNVDGIVVSFPLPKQFNARQIMNKISPFKDVDCVNSFNNNNDFGDDGFIPCTATAVMDILNYYNVDIAGKSIVVLGRSQLVGIKIADLMLKAGGRVRVCNSQTKDISCATKTADILISAVGKEGLVTCDMVKDGAVLVDVGVTIKDDRLYGDITDEAKEKALYATPVVRGVGPVTMVNLYKNLYKAYSLERKRSRFNCK